MSAGGRASRGPAPIEALEARIGHAFADRQPFLAALSHPSAAQSRGFSEYERLEFLGDRVLSLVIADELLRRYPREPEGAIAKRHTALVRREALASVALSIGVGPALTLSPGEHASGGRDNPALLADAMEALIAAVYRDGGLEAARGLIEREWADLLDGSKKPPEDAKTALQEWAQARGLPLPHYAVVGQSGPAHDPRFEVSVAVDGADPATAEGSSKRAAEKAAARLLLNRLRGSM